MKGDSYVVLFPPEDDDAWRLEAACLGLNELFFAGTTRAAKAICATCPVIEECLSYAIATRPLFGVWGGMTYNERKAAMRKRRRVVA